MQFEITQVQNGTTNNKQKTLPKNYKTKIKILAYPGLVKSGFEQSGPQLKSREKQVKVKLVLAPPKS